MNPSKSQITKWIEALRSGRYKQTHERLQDGDGYCCLGVACELFIAKNYQDLDLSNYLYGAFPNEQPAAPEWLRRIDEVILANAGQRLSDANDKDYLTFDEIADVLQAVYILEVLE